MNAMIIYKSVIDESLLDALVQELPAIIAKTLEVPGGNVARLKPEEISLDFSTANKRDVGSDLRIMVFARSNDPRISTENSRAKEILDNVVALASRSVERYSVDVRLYLMEIGAAGYSPEF